MHELQVNVSELTFTPLICATLINEILKGLLFQKSQIPYPFEWLKSVVEKKRNVKEDDVANIKSNYLFQRHYRTVAATYDTMQSLKTSLSQEFMQKGSIIRQVVIMLGDSTFCAKEVFWISVSSMAGGHIERNHILDLEKHLQKILRGIFLSENILNSIDASHNCTNTFIFIEKQISEKKENELEQEINGFQPCRPLEVPSQVAQIKINFNNSDRKQNNCCKSLTVFDDDGNQESPENDIQYSSTENPSLDSPTVWYQFKHPIKGFKDNFKDKVSISELW